MFGFSSTFNGTKDLPDLTGKVVVITGGTAGLGLASAVALASKNATVIITARSDEKGKSAIEYIKSQTGTNGDNISYGIMEQSDLRSVIGFVEWFKGLKKPLHVLMLNAGICGVPAKLIDGIESQFYVNHLSHFLLVDRLLPTIRQSGGPARIVFVAADAFKSIKEVPDWAAIASNQYPDSFAVAFNQCMHSKLANLQTAAELTRRLADTEIRINSVYPGIVATGLMKKSKFGSSFIGKTMMAISKLFLSNSDSGALNQIYVAAHPDIEAKDMRGLFFVPTAKLEPITGVALNLESQKSLWNLSEELINKILDGKQ